MTSITGTRKTSSAGSEAFCAAVDWGTTSLRIWLLSATGEVLSEARSAEGLTTASATGFQAILDKHLGDLGASSDCPVVMCGMVGSRQGWHEAPYVSTPVVLAATIDGAVRVPGLSRDVRILPGVAQHSQASPDVMRGEETQLSGAAAAGCFDADADAPVLACLPGTHSKWALITKGTMTHFSTVMTGELFTLIAEQSILRHTLAGLDLVAAADPAFAAAARAAFAAPAEWPLRLFRLRAGPLLAMPDAKNAKAWLSGSLIGAEIAGANRLAGLPAAPSSARGPADATDAADPLPVVLIASGALAKLYAGAFSACGLPFRAVDADEAVRLGLLSAARGAWLSSTKDRS